MDKYKVLIIGEHGTTGLRIYNRLISRDDLEIINIKKDYKNISIIKEYAKKVDVMFLCVPDEISESIVSEVSDVDVVIIDTSTKYRINPEWAYGFPELSEEYSNKIKNSKKISVPGCHACGCISIIYPLVKAGILPRDYPISCFSLTGYSGGGKKMINEYESISEDLRIKAPSQYGLTQKHKHLPEIKKICGLDRDILFSPIVSNYYNGMETVLSLHSDLLNIKKNPLTEVYNVFKEQYKDSNIINVFDKFDGNYLNANKLLNKDSMNIYILGNDDRIIISSIFDNLGKGAAGAAIECMNLIFGFNIEKGLYL